jgi:soluble lytic murein transglycosylase-like protein
MVVVAAMKPILLSILMSPCMAMLMEACTNIYVAAWRFRQRINQYGNTWTAVGAYHSEARKERDDYAMKIASLAARWSASPSSLNQTVVQVAAAAH